VCKARGPSRPRCLVVFSQSYRSRPAAAAPKRKVSFGAEMSPAKVVVGWQGSGDDCSEAEEEESIYSEEESGSEAVDGGCTSKQLTYVWWVRWRGASVSLFGAVPLRR